MKALSFFGREHRKDALRNRPGADERVIVAQVFCRYVLNSSLSWSEELARYLFIWMIYIGISYGVKLDKHICVDAVYSFAPKSIKRYYAIVSYLLFLLFAVAMVYYGILVVGMQISSGQVFPRYGRSHAVRVCGAVVGFVLTAIRLVQKSSSHQGPEWE